MGRPWAAATAALCGVAAGALYLAVVFGSPGVLILVYLTQLPLFAAGLWLGAGAAAIAGATATLMLFAASDATAAAMFAALNAVPVALLVRQALLARRRDDAGVAWYPPGQLTGWLTALALGGLGAAILLLGGPDAMQTELRAIVASALQRVADQGTLDTAQFADALAMVIPGVVAASWMVMTAINGILAQGLLTRFGLNWRPAPDLAILDLPLWVAVALALAAALTLFGEWPRFVGVNALIALSVPFCFGGLGVLHAATRRLSHPRAALIAFYTLAGLFGWPLIFAMALGLFETCFGLRRRLAPRRGTIDG
jgi:hypothetical protein